MRIERESAYWILVIGQGSRATRWRLDGGRVLRRQPSGREAEVLHDDVPAEVAIALLALRDASAFASAHPNETLGGPAALKRWPTTSREALVRSKIAVAGVIESWRTFRSAFEATVAATNGVAGRGP
jgi:hypothetical protein